MRGVLGGRVQRTLDHLSYLRVRYCSWPTRTIFVRQSFNASLHEPAAPFANLVLVYAQAFGDFSAMPPLCTKLEPQAQIRQLTRCFEVTDSTYTKMPVHACPETKT